MRIEMNSIIFIFILALVLTTVASAGNEIRLTNGERLTQRTAIYDNTVFWTEASANDVHYFDLNTGKKTSINGNGMYGPLAVNAYGNKVVWSGDDGESVYMYNISTHKVTKIISGILPDIYGNYIVYTRDEGIYLYNTSAHKETKIANVSSSPAIYDTQVVWSQSDSNNSFDIRKYNIFTHQTSIVTTTQNSIPESEIDIYGNVVVWTESANVSMYDISTHKKTQITKNGNASQPAIYGNLIVYTICDQGDVYSPGHTDIYMYNISTAKTTRITNSTCAFGPSIYGDKIVYADSRSYPETGEIRDIYLHDLNPEKPAADFYSPEVEEAAMYGYSSSSSEISFLDNSTGSPTSWLWDFGDGNTSTEKNPVHAYGAIGGYTVNLTVANNAGSNTTSKYGYALINGGDGNVHPAYFSSDVRSGTAPLTVLFKDDGAAGIWKTWYFGDGSTSSISIDPFDDNGLISEYTTHTYEKPGKYTVMLWYDDRGGNGLITNYHYINVTEPGKPIAAFTMNKSSDPKSLTMKFIDKSTGNPESWYWDFGDGDISTEQNPTHTYLTKGRFNVNLTVSNENGQSSKLVEINVENSSLKTQYAYIANFGSNTVSVIDNGTKTVIDTVDVGQGPSGVAVTPDRSKVYVTNANSNTVSVINTSRNEVVATVGVGTGPYGVAVNPDGSQVYVTNLHDNSVSVIDTASNNVIASVPVGSWPEGIAFTPDGTKAYVANYYSYNIISVIDTATNTVTAAVVDPELYGPSGIAVAPDGTKAYITSNFNDKVFVINTTSNQVTDNISVGDGPHGVAVSPDGKRVYVVNGNGNTISVIDTTINKVVATVPVGNQPYGVSVSKDGKIAYVTNYRSNSVSLIDTATNKVINTVFVGNNPKSFGQFISYSPALPDELPVADFTRNVTEGHAPLTVQFSDLSENAKGWNWEFGDGTNSTDRNPTHTYSAAGIYDVNLTASNVNGIDSKHATINVLKPASPCAYISNYVSNSVSVIDTATNNVISTVPVGICPSGVVVNPEGTETYVANTMDGTVSVIDTATNTVTATVPVGSNPVGVAVNPSGTKVYVANMPDSTVSVIDTATKSPISTVSVGHPYGIAVNPAGTKVYVTNYYENEVSVIDTGTNDITATVDVGRYPKGIIVNQDGTKVYVVNSDSDSSSNYTCTVSIIDTATNNITANVPVGKNPWGIALSPDGYKIYVTNYENNTLSVIDTASNAVTATLPVGSNPSGVAFSLDGTRAFVANAGSYDTIGNTVTIIDTESDTVSGEVKVGIHPIAFGQFTGSFQAFKPVLIVANFSSNVTNGSAPLTVQFTDLSVKAKQWYWDFGDGNISTEQNPSHKFDTPGNYTVNLTVSNSNRTSFKTTIIEVLDANSSEISSNGDGSGNSNESNISGSRRESADSSSEPQNNIESKEMSQAFISSGSSTKFDFPQQATPIQNISLDSKKTAGMTTTVVEMLKKQSILVSEAPSNEVYKFINIWVGTSGLSNTKNIKNAFVCFKVEKSWIQDKTIDRSSVTLNRYNDNKWNSLTTILSGEDENYLYFTAQTPGFSPFAITGKTTANIKGTLPAVEKTQPSVNNTQTKLNTGNETAHPEQKLKKTNNSNISGKSSTRAPGFEITSCIVCLLCIYFCRKRL